MFKLLGLWNQRPVKALQAARCNFSSNICNEYRFCLLGSFSDSPSCHALHHVIGYIHIHWCISPSGEPDGIGDTPCPTRRQRGNTWHAAPSRIHIGFQSEIFQLFGWASKSLDTYHRYTEPLGKTQKCLLVTKCPHHIHGNKLGDGLAKWEKWECGRTRWWNVWSVLMFRFTNSHRLRGANMLTRSNKPATSK